MREYLPPTPTNARVMQGQGQRVLMNWLDFSIIAFIAVVALTAFRRGFIREFLGLIAVVAGVIIAGLFHDDVAISLETLTGETTWAHISTFLAIFLAISIIGWIISLVLRSTVDLFVLGWADHAAGAIFGIIKSVIIIQAAMVIFVFQPALGMEAAIADSLIGPIFLDSTSIVHALLPNEFDRAIQEFFS